MEVFRRTPGSNSNITFTLGLVQIMCNITVLFSSVVHVSASKNGIDCHYLSVAKILFLHSRSGSKLTVCF